MNIQNLCPFFGKCGGCLYQDMSDQAYRAHKESFVLRSFADRGLTPPVMPMREIPLRTRRRASFAYANGHIGYNALHSHQLIEITDCRLLKPSITTGLNWVRTWVKTLKGSGDIFMLDTPWGLDIHIRPAKGTSPNLTMREHLALWAGDSHVARISYNNEPILAKVSLPFLPDAFLQPSQEGEDILIDLVLKAAQGSRRAVDLFCGRGTFTRPLADTGIQITGYDCARDSVSVLGPRGHIRDLFRNPLTSDELAELDLIILDPPRAGALTQTQQIAETAVPKIIMVSCNPKTAARDCKILSDAGWVIESITPVDQFKWSNHIELVCVLVKH